MATYTYACSNCGHVWDGYYKIANRKDPETKPCPACSSIGSVSQQITPVSFGDSIRMGMSGRDNGFKEVLQKIHERTPGSRLNDASTINKV